jgi:hypothetical protein
MQLVLGLEHVIAGSTMIVLLHKPEEMNTAKILQSFSHFSSVKLLKPVQSHAKQSSFYMIASNLQPNHLKAVEAVESWKHAWKVATFGTDEDRANEAHRECSAAVQLLNDFSPDLIRMGQRIWDIQARALAKAPFIARPSGIARSRAKDRWWLVCTYGGIKEHVTSFRVDHDSSIVTGQARDMLIVCLLIRWQVSRGSASPANSVLNCIMVAQVHSYCRAPLSGRNCDALGSTFHSRSRFVTLLASRFAITKKSTSSTRTYATIKVAIDNLKKQNDRYLLGLYNDTAK